MHPLKFGMATVDGADADTRSTHLAATIGAFDVPLKHDRPWTTSRGDGLDGPRVTFHFDQHNPTGPSPKWLIAHWLDDLWIEQNADHPLAKVKAAFAACKHLQAVMHGSETMDRFAGGPSHFTGDTRQAACMIGLGHQCTGWSRDGDVWLWHFDQSAASDLALFEDANLCDVLPTEPIAYIRAALWNHKICVDICKNVQFARVEHRGRIALVPANAGSREVELYERKLYRK